MGGPKLPVQTKYKKNFGSGNDEEHAGPEARRVPEKSRTQDAFVEIESLSKSDRRPDQSGRRYIIISSLYF